MRRLTKSGVDPGGDGGRKMISIILQINKRLAILRRPIWTGSLLHCAENHEP
jgi:hypothetical protein